MFLACLAALIPVVSTGIEVAERRKRFLQLLTAVVIVKPFVVKA